jgi:hypothetical protein
MVSEEESEPKNIGLLKDSLFLVHLKTNIRDE